MLYSEKLNSQWITEMYGEIINKSISSNRIICMGTVWGTSIEFLEFIRQLNHRLKEPPTQCITVNDQGAANVMIYHDKMFADCIVKSDNQTGYVMTIGHSMCGDVKIDSQDNVLTALFGINKISK